MIYKNRLIKIPENDNTFLFGVRGSGKTLLLNRLFPKALYIDLLSTLFAKMPFIFLLGKMN